MLKFICAIMLMAFVFVSADTNTLCKVDADCKDVNLGPAMSGMAPVCADVTVTMGSNIMNSRVCVGDALCGNDVKMGSGDDIYETKINCGGSALVIIIVVIAVILVGAIVGVILFKKIK